MSRLADIYKSEKAKGGGLVSAAKARLKEKLDPRQMFDQSGLMAAMFPSLFKSYRYKPAGVSSFKSPLSSMAPAPSENKVQTEFLITEIRELKTHSKISAKNSMVLPAMARDMNLVRQNIGRLVKLSGGTTATKSDMFFKRASEREAEYESRFRREGGTSKPTPEKKEKDKKEGGGILGSLLGIGASIASAIGSVLSPILSVLSRISDFLGPLLKDGLKLAFSAGGKILKFAASGLGSIMKNILPFLFNPAVLSLIGVGGIAWLIKTLVENDTTPEGEMTVAGRESGGPADLAQQQGPEGAPYIKPNMTQAESVGGRAGVADKIDKMNKMQEPRRTFELLQDYETMVTGEGEPQQKVPKETLYKLLGESNPTLQGTQLNKRGIELYLKEKHGEKRDVSFDDTDRKASGQVQTVPSTTPEKLNFIPSNVEGGRGNVIPPTTTPPVESVSPTPTTGNELLNLISRGESVGGSYNSMNQGTVKNRIIGSGVSNVVIGENLTDMTVGQILNRAPREGDGEQERKSKRSIFAAGRYQIIPNTLRSLVKEGVVSEEEKFTPEVQDRLALRLIERRGVNKLVNQGKLEEAQYQLAKEWASISVPKGMKLESGQISTGVESYYGGANKAKGDLGSSVMAALGKMSPQMTPPVPTMGTSLAASTRNVDDTKMQLATAPPVVINAPTNNVTSNRPSSTPSIPIPSIVDDDMMKLLVDRAIS